MLSLPVQGVGAPGAAATVFSARAGGQRNEGWPVPSWTWRMKKSQNFPPPLEPLFAPEVRCLSGVSVMLAKDTEIKFIVTPLNYQAKEHVF